MTTASDYQSQINSLNAEMGGLQARNSEIERLIERLLCAKNEVMAIRNDMRSFVSWVNTYDVGCSWLGENREDFETEKSDASSAGYVYIDNVDTRLEDIGEKIKQLRQEQSSNNSSMRGMSLSIWQLSAQQNLASLLSS